MYSMDGRVRYSEVDFDGIITLDAIVNYLQDCAMLHSEEVGRGVRNISSDAKGFWLMASWQIDIVKAPRYYDVIRVVTSPYEFKGFFGGRNIAILDEDGQYLVKANTMWVYMNKASGKPDRIPADEAEAYAPFGEKLDMEYMPRKIILPERMTKLSEVPVRLDQIDTNHHVNNCEYVRTAMAVSGIYELPKTLRVEYKQAAVMGDDFCPEEYRDDNRCVIDLHGQDGTPFAVVEFIFA